MAYMSQERKAKISARIKPILKKYGVKATLSVHNHSTIALNIQSGAIDFIGNYVSVSDASEAVKQSAASSGYKEVNPYWYHKSFDGVALEFMGAVFAALNLVDDEDANFNDSDMQSDYHCVGWYVAVNVGRYNKPYVLTQPAQAAA